MSRVYIAAAYGEAKRAEHEAQLHRDAGFEVTSTWHVSPHPDGDEGIVGDTTREVAATRCLEEVDAADAVIIYAWGNPRGTYFEAGYAYARGKDLVWVDDGHPIFDSLGRRERAL